MLASGQVRNLSPVASALIQVAPRVSPAGTTVAAQGTCTTSPRFLVIGQPAGWFDTPPTYVDVTPGVGASGSWVVQFPMPALPSTVAASCPDGSTPAVSIAPSVDPPSGSPALRDGNGYIVSVQKVSQPDALEVFTAKGEPVASTEVLRQQIGEGWSITLRVTPAWPDTQIVVLGFEALGENANARQVTRVQSWSKALSPSPLSAAEATRPAVRLPPGA